MSVRVSVRASFIVRVGGRVRFSSQSVRVGVSVSVCHGWLPRALPLCAGGGGKTNG